VPPVVVVTVSPPRFCQEAYFSLCAVGRIYWYLHSDSCADRALRSLRVSGRNC